MVLTARMNWSGPQQEISPLMKSGASSADV